MSVFDNFRESAVAARVKAFAGRSALAGDVREANLSTGDRLKRLAITERFMGNDFALYLIVDKATSECEYWAYGEKTDAGGFVFAFGAGNLKSGMKITDCAVISTDQLDDPRYEYGGEMEDTGQEVRLGQRLDDMAFSSRISELSGDAGNHKRTIFSGKLKQLTEEAPFEAAAAPASPEAAAPASSAPSPAAASQKPAAGPAASVAAPAAPRPASDAVSGSKRRSTARPAEDEDEDERDEDGE